jgi:hypothetical protein
VRARSELCPAVFTTSVVKANEPLPVSDRRIASGTLLGNPDAEAANVTITYLRSDGTTVTGGYVVPPHSRYSLLVTAQVPGLSDESFGAVIQVTNNVGIVVERSLYWNAGGVVWAGGSNVGATPVP